jgi:hypothetical protein
MHAALHVERGLQQQSLIHGHVDREIIGYTKKREKETDRETRGNETGDQTKAKS